MLFNNNLKLNENKNFETQLGKMWTRKHGNSLQIFVKTRESDP